MLVLKIMSAVRGNDDHPRHGHRVISGVAEVGFREPKVNVARALGGGPKERATMTYRFAGSDEAIAEPLAGNVYVMNEAGRTISRFEVASPPPDNVEIFETAAAGRETR